MGTVDEENRLNFYDGKIRVVDPDGRELLQYNPSEYANHISPRTRQVVGARAAARYRHLGD